MTTLDSGAVYLAVFIVAGVTWSLSGFINGIRAHANFEKANPGQKDPDWNGFNPKAMRDDIFIGLILGFVAFLVNGSTSLPPITTLQAFAGAVIASYGLIGLSDKIFVGAVLNK